MEFIVAVLAFLSVAGLTVIGALFALRWDPVAKRLRGLQTANSETASISILRDAPDRPVPQWRKTVEKLGGILLPRGDARDNKKQSSVRRKLLWAGYDHPRAILVFLGVKVVLSMACAYSY